MPSLLDVPELVGFFSYSREDDQGSRGALSALRDAIQTELSAQLGRTQADFRLWQDKAAISLGTLWEKQISKGIGQSVFFIPIITPRVLKSHYCAYEFQAFLAREKELGRDDLVFPILYIPVPALEDQKLWRDDPILKIVGTRQYLDWRELRHHDPRSVEVQKKLEWYCRGITNALQKSWIAPISAYSERGEEKAEVREKSTLHDGVGAAEDGELNRKSETRLVVAAEHSGQQVTKQRIQHERTFPWVKSRVVVTLAAALAIVVCGSLAAWLAPWPTRPTQISSATDKKVADAVTPPLISVPAPASRPAPDEAAWTLIHDTNDAAALRRFVTQFPESERRKDVEARLDYLMALQAAWKSVRDSKDPDQLRQFIKQFPDSEWRNDVETRLNSLLTAQAAWNSVRDSKDPDQLRQFIKQFPDSEWRNDAEAHLDSFLTAESAWNSVKNSKDPDQLRQFVKQFPDNARRNDAQVRLDSLLAARDAWNSLSHSEDPDKLRQFVKQFPDSNERLIAEQRIASLEQVAKPDPHELARALQFELQRVGCFKGTINGQFDEDTKTAWHRFMKRTSISMSDDLSPGTVDAVRGITKRICSLDCPHGQHAEGETCVANAEAPADHDAKPRARTKAPSVSRTARSPDTTAPQKNRTPSPADMATPPPGRVAPSIPLMIGIGGGHGGFSIGVGP